MSARTFRPNDGQGLKLLLLLTNFVLIEVRKEGAGLAAGAVGEWEGGVFEWFWREIP